MDSEKIVYYLAYGSNLSAETFLGRRGIRPLSAINVVVPSLRLRFDLPGIPYAEPCFANSGLRPQDELLQDIEPELGTLLQDNGQLESQEYHKDRWHKGMVGVVYGLTPQDYAHVIATEGAGASYKDVQVECFPLVPGEQKVPDEPKTAALKAHTLLAGADRTSRRRPDPSYAQPSARYLKLLTDGAREHALPLEYTEYLAQIRPYNATTTRQRMGRVIFLALWMPLVMALFKLMRAFTDSKGRAPEWAQRLSMSVFALCWNSYDVLFKPIFGDGERTIGQGEDSMRSLGIGAPLRPLAAVTEAQKAASVGSL